MAEAVLGMHHIGVTVPDIEEGIAFFKKVFGAEEIFRTGPFDVDANFMKAKLGAAPIPHPGPCLPALRKRHQCRVV
ncbi:MAG: VOC family protein [Rhizobiales bacterium]|nr:VOC family protein [Hyphomicrobiales bacterium]